jgi:hypothetical protein
MVIDNETRSLGRFLARSLAALSVVGLSACYTPPMIVRDVAGEPVEGPAIAPNEYATIARAGISYGARDRNACGLIRDLPPEARPAACIEPPAPYPGTAQDVNAIQLHAIAQRGQRGEFFEVRRLSYAFVKTARARTSDGRAKLSGPVVRMAIEGALISAKIADAQAFASAYRVPFSDVRFRARMLGQEAAWLGRQRLEDEPGLTQQETRRKEPTSCDDAALTREGLYIARDCARSWNIGETLRLADLDQPAARRLAYAMTWFQPAVLDDLSDREGVDARTFDDELVTRAEVSLRLRLGAPLSSLGVDARFQSCLREGSFESCAAHCQQQRDKLSVRLLRLCVFAANGQAQASSAGEASFDWISVYNATRMGTTDCHRALSAFPFDPLLLRTCLVRTPDPKWRLRLALVAESSAERALSHGPN